MLSPIPTTGHSSHTRPHHRHREKYYTLGNFKECPELIDQLRETAIRHISGDLLKALTAVQLTEFVESKDSVNIPYGLFGLSLDDFYKRRQENMVYIGVLELVDKQTLDRAKICTVLDDLQELIKNLFLGYHCNNLSPMVQTITDSQKLLQIHETIADDFTNNTETLKKLRDKLNAFNVHERNAFNYANNQVYNVQNECVEVEFVLEPIEWRYKLNHHKQDTQQLEHKLLLAEDELKKKLAAIESARTRDENVSEYVCIKQRMDIETLKFKLQTMHERYEKDYESLDGQISYKTIAMEIMNDHYKDCIKKLEFFAEEIVKLREWDQEWEMKKRAERMNVLEKPNKKAAGKKGGKKKKSKK